jgi:hypothetical protein
MVSFFEEDGEFEWQGAQRNVWDALRRVGWVFRVPPGLDSSEIGLEMRRGLWRAIFVLPINLPNQEIHTRFLALAFDFSIACSRYDGFFGGSESPKG